MTKWLALCVFFVVSVPGAPTRAEELDEPADASGERPAEVSRAEDYAAQAYEAYAEQDYGRAVSLYRLALAAAASPDIIYNLARIYDTKLKDRTHAMEFYTRYTQDPGADPERAKVAVSRLSALRELGRLQSATAQPAAAQPSANRLEAPAPASPQRQRSDSGVSALTVASVVIGTVGLGGVGVGIGYGIVAKSKADTSHQLCDGNLCRSSRGVETTRQATNAATISTISFIAGGALVATAVTLLIVGATHSEESAPVTAYVDPHGAGAQWVAKF